MTVRQPLTIALEALREIERNAGCDGSEHRWTALQALAAIESSQKGRPMTDTSAPAQDGAADVLNEIRTIMNRSKHWPAGMTVVDAIRALVARAETAPTPGMDTQPPGWIQCPECLAGFPIADAQQLAEGGWNPRLLADLRILVKQNGLSQKDFDLIRAWAEAAAAPRAPGAEPAELEMHRADYQACRDAGWESPSELLAGYKYLAQQDTAKARKIDELIAALTPKAPAEPASRLIQIGAVRVIGGSDERGVREWREVEPDALPREEFASLVVQEACETDPADEDDPECIRILRNDLKSAVLAAFMRNRKTKPAESVLKESIEWLTDYCKRPSPGEEHLPHLRILLASQARKDGK